MKIPLILRIALVVLVLSVILSFVGFASNVWFSVEDLFHYGLWKFCPKEERCVDLDDGLKEGSLNYMGGKLHSTGSIRGACACCGLGLALVVATGLFGPYYTARSPTRQDLISAIASILLVGGVMNCIGAVVYLATKPGTITLQGMAAKSVEVGWSAILTVLGGVGQIATGLLVILPVRFGRLQIEDDDGDHRHDYL